MDYPKMMGLNNLPLIEVKVSIDGALRGFLCLYKKGEAWFVIWRDARMQEDWNKPELCEDSVYVFSDRDKAEEKCEKMMMDIFGS